MSNFTNSNSSGWVVLDFTFLFFRDFSRQENEQ